MSRAGERGRPRARAFRAFFRFARVWRVGWLLFPILAASLPAEGSEWFDLARAGNEAEIRRMIDLGSDPNQSDSKGRTALTIASRDGHVEVVRELTQHGVFVDQAEFNGDTALVKASEEGHVEIVRLLLGHGADTTLESSSGFTAIQLARRQGHSELVRLLSEAGRRARSAPSPTGVLGQASAAPFARKSAGPSQKRYQAGYRRRIAAVIGINDYLHWPSLAGARGDAKRVASQFRTMGFDDVFELHDRQATRAAILDLLGQRLATVAEEDDLVVIYFAGHGQTEILNEETGLKRGYIIPVDATVKGVFSTAIPMPKLRELTRRLPAKHIYFAMDSCYSGLGFTRGVAIVRESEPDYIGKVTSLRAVQMVTAGGAGEEAIEREGEGVFTQGFLEALSGAADGNGDGFITATEIGAYVAPWVTNKTRGRQSPQSGRLEGEGEIAFELLAREKK